ncbi:50S ribosomal protein L6 [candidate division WOR-3 bacterium]|nr:50S ribosomal protein L6 [candidate division WOR-3 bacterium]
MSKIGKKSIPIPEGVSVEIKKNRVTVKGPKGSLVKEFHPDFNLVEKEGNLFVIPKRKSRFLLPYFGLTRTLLANMVNGVRDGYSKTLDIIGIGYKAKISGDLLELSLGFSHPITYKVPEGIKIETPAPQKIMVNGIDKELVGNTASVIRRFRPPEPYKGKGIRYEGEYVRRKQGKRSVSTGI